MFYQYKNDMLHFNRKSLEASNWDSGRIESEYIRNLQQQVYFLELETNYLYPLNFRSDRK